VLQIQVILLLLLLQTIQQIQVHPQSLEMILLHWLEFMI
jgi:hypothetical protein